jgi:LuxR family transcriptional regulator, maltose regulon positive regulatory protein
VLVPVAVARCNVERAYALLEQAENVGHERRWDRLVAAALLERTKLYLSEGRIAEASASCVRLERLAGACDVNVPCAASDVQNYRGLATACLAVARNRPQEATGALTRLLQEAEAAQRETLAIRLRLKIAMVLLAANDRGKALEVFRKALRAAAPAGFYQTILEQGTEVGALLTAAREAIDRSPFFKDELAYVDRLQQGWKSLYKAEPEQGGGACKEPLSPRERNILQLIAEGQSNKEIARTLGVAPETVKSHVKNIFVKLDVERRAQAVARAQSLGVVRS